MKKFIVILSVLILILGILSACGKVKNDKSEKKTTASTTAFTTGNDAGTTKIEMNNEKNVVHQDEKGNDLLVEHFGADGKISYYFEQIYDNAGQVIGFKYYDSKKKLVGSNENGNHFFDKDGKELSEDEFAVLMRNAGIE